MTEMILSISLILRSLSKILDDKNMHEQIIIYIGYS
jgi:hypothetical protein